ncbi:hypothetical protein TNCV_4176511 [Trichonephila clavipes]|nr:hypothetical protein TNCV_4176511 [Trichonephila clavipes]
MPKSSACSLFMSCFLLLVIALSHSQHYIEDQECVSILPKNYKKYEVPVYQVPIDDVLSVGYSLRPALWSRWSPSILAWLQSGQASSAASGGILLPKSHVRWLGEDVQQPRFSPGAS